MTNIRYKESLSKTKEKERLEKKTTEKLQEILKERKLKLRKKLPNKMVPLKRRYRT